MFLLYRLFQSFKKQSRKGVAGCMNFSKEFVNHERLRNTDVGSLLVYIRKELTYFYTLAFNFFDFVPHFFYDFDFYSYIFGPSHEFFHSRAFLNMKHSVQWSRKLIYLNLFECITINIIGRPYENSILIPPIDCFFGLAA